VATSIEAGGDLWELDLMTSGAVNRTAGVAPRDFKSGGLMLLDAWGLGVSDQDVVRFERVPGGVAGTVQLPRAVSVYGSDVVASEDQSTVAFLAGNGSSRQRVFTCRRSGDASQASDQAMPISGAGFLPDEPSGPTLALSTDGSWVAWRRSGSSNELYARQTGSGPRPTDMHLTGPANFSNTLSDTGVIAFFSPDSLTAVIGDDDHEGIGSADVFSIVLTPGSVATSNLSRTSGLLQSPYDYGTINAFDGLFRIPGPQPMFIAYDSGGQGRIWKFDTQGMLHLMLARVEEIQSVTLAGDHVVAQVIRSAGVDDPLLETLNLVQFSAGATQPTLLRLPSGLRISRQSSMSSRNLFGGVMELDTGGEWLGRVTVPTSAGASLTNFPRNYGPTTGLSSDGTLYATMLSGSRQLVLRWSDTDAKLLKNSPGGTFILPGL
jgi:hypothetical protein